MAVRVELPREIVESALNKHVASLRRAIKEATNPIIKDALNTELSSAIKATGTLTEAK